MNVSEGLQRIRERLLDNGARRETLALVDAIAQRAALPAAQQANAQSLLQLARMLQRSPVATNNIDVYNDLLRLEEDLEAAGTAYRERMAAEERIIEAAAREANAPKGRKFYKDQKEKERGR
ncbi:MAG: hypothetical protein H0U10_17090 [Chloroflexia bacterium]|nr:hypothetical protein [Chloroflexia bacterium]